MEIAPERLGWKQPKPMGGNCERIGRHGPRFGHFGDGRGSQDISFSSSAACRAPCVSGKLVMIFPNTSIAASLAAAFSLSSSKSLAVLREADAACSASMAGGDGWLADGGTDCT